MEKMTLLDFSNSIGHCVCFWSGVGSPSGTYEVMDSLEWECPPDLADLEGEVQDEKWEWDGLGDPRDIRGNSILRVTAFNDRERRLRLIRDSQNS